MANQWSVKHIRTINELPTNLVIGRAYFIDDVQYIVIDHGNGPVIYGSRTGPQGQPGEPLPMLQAQIDSLTEAAINNAFNIQTFNNNRKSQINALKSETQADIAALNFQTQNDIKFILDNRLSDIHEIFKQITTLSEALISQAALISTLSEHLRSTENILLKILIEADKETSIEPLKPNDTVTTEYGSWLITEITTNEDGSSTFIFTKNKS